MNDFQAIGAVVSDTRLINHELSPSSYGVPKGSDDTVSLEPGSFNLCGRNKEPGTWSEEVGHASSIINST